MKISNQRLRNLTTGRMHTSLADIQFDIEALVGTDGLFIHQIPAAYTALLPWLKERVTEARFWDGAYDLSHDGETEIEPMNEEEQKAFWKSYMDQPSPFSK